MYAPFGLATPTCSRQYNWRHLFILVYFFCYLKVDYLEIGRNDSCYPKKIEKDGYLYNFFIILIKEY